MLSAIEDYCGGLIGQKYRGVEREEQLYSRSPSRADKLYHVLCKSLVGPRHHGDEDGRVLHLKGGEGPQTPASTCPTSRLAIS